MGGEKLASRHSGLQVLLLLLLLLPMLLLLQMLLLLLLPVMLLWPTQQLMMMPLWQCALQLQHQRLSRDCMHIRTPVRLSRDYRGSIAGIALHPSASPCGSL